LHESFSHSAKSGLTVGKTDEEQYALESVADVVRDHLAAVIKLFRSEDAQLIDEHFQNNSLKYLKAYDVFYGENAGPYYLGEQVCTHKYSNAMN
jgi:glutathione S-transferase